MRPGRLGPGRPRSTSTTCGAATCFNEAGAIRPRKVASGLSLHLMSAGFNEAGAIRPRKAGDASGWGFVDRLRFNEAGAIRPRKDFMNRHGGDGWIASMRPGRLGPGRPRMHGRGGARCLASMRPGRLGPGRHWCSVIQILLSPRASMRPGRLGPGRRLERMETLLGEALQ